MRDGVKECPGCRGEIPEEAWHCPNCGYRFRELVGFIGGVLAGLKGSGELK